MTQDLPPFQRPSGLRNAQVHLRDLNPGDTIKVIQGGTVEVVMNPRDGLWLVVRYVEAPPEGPESVGEDQMLYFEDVGELVSTAHREHE